MTEAGGHGVAIGSGQTVVVPTATRWRTSGVTTGRRREERTPFFHEALGSVGKVFVGRLASQLVNVLTQSRSLEKGTLTQLVT